MVSPIWPVLEKSNSPIDLVRIKGIIIIRITPTINMTFAFLYILGSMFTYVSNKRPFPIPVSHPKKQLHILYSSFDLEWPSTYTR